MNFITPFKQRKLASFLGFVREKNFPPPPNKLLKCALKDIWVVGYKGECFQSLNGPPTPHMHAMRKPKKIPLLPIALVDNSKTFLTFYYILEE
jgi:hypothetical protein